MTELSESLIAQTIAEGADLGLEKSAIMNAIQSASMWADSYNNDDNSAFVLPGIYDSQPNWESVEAPAHIRVSFSSLEPGAVSQYAVFPV